MSWAAALDTIGLEELNAAAALQTRTDRKYIIPAERTATLLPQLAAGSRVLSVDDRRSFAYASVYFDTPQLASFHLAAHPRRRRFKIRTRSYLDSGQCFLEVKTEGARAQTVKERIEHAPQAARRLDAAALDYITETLVHELGHCPIDVRDLRPVLESRYSRTTLYRQDSNSRVTVDEQLCWIDPGSGRRLGCAEVVVETKSALNAGPADRLLWRQGIRPSRISKFATGLHLLHTQLPGNRWHRTTTHQLTTDPAPTP